MILCKCSWVTFLTGIKKRRRIPWQSGSRDELQGSGERNLAQSRHRGGKRKPRNYNWKKKFQNLINQMHAGEVDWSLRKTSRRPKVVGKNNLIWEKQQKTEQSCEHDWMSVKCNWMIQHWYVEIKMSHSTDQVLTWSLHHLIQYKGLCRVFVFIFYTFEFLEF